ncbi:MAG: ABC transporter permease subunit [Desulfobacteraceae bacterium]|nr:ABC transporter permease subunit [Desulfobacteraceae bacterium]
MSNGISLVAAITIKEGLRNRAMQGILAIAVLLCLAYITIIPMFAFDTGKVAVDLGSAFVTVAGLAIVIFLGIALLTKDIHQRTVCMILSRPISRTDYVIGKYCGLAVTVLLAVLMIAGLTIFTSWIGTKLILEMKPPRNFSWGVLSISVFFQYLSLLLLMAVAFFFACLTTSEYLSMLFTVGIYVIGNSLETIIAVIQEGQYVKVGPAYLAILKAVAWIFPNLSAFDLKVYLSYGLPLPWSQVGWTAAYGICYISLLAVATLWIFKRKEIT